MHRVTVAVFDDTLAELPAISIKEGVASCRDFRPDVIVGVGGSCMNKAKLVSLLLTHGAPLDRDYGEFKVPGPVIPVVAILTTAGTGSEVTPVAVLGSWCLVSPSMESSILRRDGLLAWRTSTST